MPILHQKQILVNQPIIEAIIIGIGINVSTSEFPSELQNRATSLGLNNANRNQFIAEILRQLFSIIDENFDTAFQ